MTVRENHAFLSEMYAVDVSPDLLSSVTDVVIAEVDTSQSRLLKAIYAVAVPRCPARTPTWAIMPRKTRQRAWQRRRRSDN
jgi:hypothetical protein